MKHFYFLLFFIASTIYSKAQAPSTTCTTAPIIAIGGCATTPTGVTGTVNTVGGTPSCIGASSTTFKKEGWYSFVCSTTQSVTFTASTTSASSDLVIELFPSACPVTTALACANFVQATGAQTEALTYPCVAGNTYLIRLSNFTSSASGAMNLTRFCIYETPVNDECATPISLTPTISCNPVAGTSIGGTPSSIVACIANQANDDVWYSFIAIDTVHVVTVASIGTYNAVMQVFTGGCGVGSLGCINASGAGGTETQLLTGLTIGTTYYVRVYDAGTGVPSASGFTICVTIPPANDECAGAYPITTAVGVCNSVAGTLEGASPSGVLPYCSAVSPNDVWFTFTTPAGVTSQTITVSGVTGSFNPIIELFGGTCGSLSSIDVNSVTCGNTSGAGQTESDQWVRTLTPNTQYWVRVYDSTGTTANPNFNICAESPPANDEQCNAVNLIPGTDCSGAATALGDVAGATNTGIQVNGLCAASIADDDVWYSFTTNSTSGQSYTVAVSPDASSTFDPIFEIFTYTGSCNNLTSYGCHNANGPGGAESYTYTTANFPALAVNTTYYVRVYDAGIAPPSSTSFHICVITTPLPFSSIICSSTGASCINPNSGTATVLSTGGTPPYTYQWSPSGGTASSAVGLPAGNYTVTVHDNLSAVTSASVVIIQYGATSASISHTSCFSYTLNGTMYTLTGTYTQTLVNANSCDSVLTIHVTINNPTANSISPLACNQYVLNGQTYTANGVYSQSLINAHGCDSILTIHLTIQNVDTSVTQNGNVLTASASGATYQWLDCGNNYSLITGETNQTYTTASDGSYALMISTNGCIADTSSCYNITSVSIAEIAEDNIRIFPNPATNELNIESLNNKVRSIKIIDVLGNVVLQQPTTNNQQLTTNISSLQNGIYFVEILTERGKTVKKVVKQ